MKPALAIFVKTPGLTPLKTRLAKTIGEKMALEFYNHSLKAVTETIKNSPVEPFWAVAEKEGAQGNFWKDFNVLHTGDGDLGQRQCYIYNHLLSLGHKEVVLIGADAPQLSSEIVSKALNKLNEKTNFIFGPANDGGYYLLAGNKEIPANIWSEVPWSDEKTLEVFKKRLSDKYQNECLELKVLTDVDEEEDLKQVINEMPSSPNASQLELVSWIENLQKQL